MPNLSHPYPFPLYADNVQGNDEEMTLNYSAVVPNKPKIHFGTNAQVLSITCHTQLSDEMILGEH